QERLMHERLALGIERIRRLIEDEDPRSAKDRARDRQALALAARQLDAPRADRGREPGGEALDELPGARHLGGRGHLGVAPLGEPKADVVGDRARKEHRFLQDDRSEEHTSELQSPCNLVCRLLLEKKKKNIKR